jgi:hypothetical protein
MVFINGKFQGRNAQQALGRHRLEENEKSKNKSKNTTTKDPLQDHLDQASEHLAAARDLHSGKSSMDNMQQDQDEPKTNALSALGLSQNSEN